MNVHVRMLWYATIWGKKPNFHLEYDSTPTAYVFFHIFPCVSIGLYTARVKVLEQSDRKKHIFPDRSLLQAGPYEKITWNQTLTKY